MTALHILNFVKPALGMPAMPPITSRTTLVNFFNLDVDLGFFIFTKLDRYKTPLSQPVVTLLISTSNTFFNLSYEFLPSHLRFSFRLNFSGKLLLGMARVLVFYQCVIFSLMSHSPHL